MPDSCTASSSATVCNSLSKEISTYFDRLDSDRVHEVYCTALELNCATLRCQTGPWTWHGGLVMDKWLCNRISLLIHLVFKKTLSESDDQSSSTCFAKRGNSKREWMKITIDSKVTILARSCSHLIPNTTSPVSWADSCTFFGTYPSSRQLVMRLDQWGNNILLKWFKMRKISFRYHWQ